MASKFRWALFIFFAVGVGLYPVAYLFSSGVLATKPVELLATMVYKPGFYLHISFGGLALLTGWSQFSKSFRSRNLNFHRTLGKTYLISVLISGLCGLYIAFYAMGGIVPQVGFGGLAMAWLFTSSSAYRSIRSKDIDSHEKWMIRSYALTFAAVTLRLWIPTFAVAGMEFVEAYRIIAWLC
jgi:hypothetical protein